MSAKEITGAVRKALDSKVTDLAKRRADDEHVCSLPPHRDDLVEWLSDRVTAGAAERAERTVARYFDAAKHMRGVDVDTHADGFSLLTVEKYPTGTPASPPALTALSAELSLDMLAVLLRPALRAEAERLVDRLWPEAKRGIRSKDRAEKRAKLAKEIETLERDIAELRNELKAAIEAAGVVA